MKVILVCVGNFQPYVVDCIAQLKLWGNDDIDVITNAHFFEHFSGVNLVNCDELNDYRYTQLSAIDRHFRDGFWFYASQRLFYLYSHIKQNNIKRSVHIENDVMVYENLDKLTFEKKLYAVYDSPTRVIPSFIYIPSHKYFRTVIEKYNPQLNDMVNMGRYDFMEPLPIIHSTGAAGEEITRYNKNFAQFGAIFDGAAIGQYLAGVDPRNQPGDTRGFVNETCVVKYDQYRFCWLLAENGLCRPYLMSGDDIIPIVNLHIHSKKLNLMRSDSYKGDTYITTKII